MREDFNATQEPVGERKERHRQGAGAARGDRAGQRRDLEQAQRELRPRTRPARAQVRHAAAAAKAAGGGGAAGRAGQAVTACCATRVTEEEIARIVERWTGIPVAKLMEGEREKLLHLEDILHQRVIGQDEAVSQRGRGHSPLPRRHSGSQPAHRFLPVPRPHRRRQDGAGQGAGRKRCLTTKRTWCAST